jgi:hypothetical protein
MKDHWTNDTIDYVRHEINAKLCRACWAVTAVQNPANRPNFIKAAIGALVVFSGFVISALMRD